MNRYAVYFNDGATKIFDAEKVEFRDEVVTLSANGGPDVWIPVGLVRYVQKHETVAEVITTKAPEHPPAVRVGDDDLDLTPHGEPLGLTMRQLAVFEGVSAETIRERLRHDRYPNAYKEGGVRGGARWIIPLSDIPNWESQDV